VDTVAEVLRTARRIAVVGLSPKPWRPSHGVARYLQEAGYEVVPVHPAGGVTLGEPVHLTLESVRDAGPIDIVNIFRRSAAVGDLADACVAVTPRLVWMQVGVSHADAARRLKEADILVVMNRCIAVAHQRLGE
jgi:predicted CoA-binding protein